MQLDSGSTILQINNEMLMSNPSLSRILQYYASSYDPTEGGGSVRKITIGSHVQVHGARKDRDV